eukprot:6195510-Pleurochrysis_carterae.AAC.2
MSSNVSDSSDNFEDVLLDNVGSILPKVCPPNVQKELDKAVLMSDSSEGSSRAALGSQPNDSSFADDVAPASATKHVSYRLTSNTLPSDRQTDHSEVFFGAELSSDEEASHIADSDSSHDQAAFARRAQNCFASANTANAASNQNASTNPAQAAAGAALDVGIYETERGKYD